MTIGRIPNIQGGIQPTIIDAKGDLITGVSNDTPARLGVGADGTMLIADSTQATGLNWAASPGFTAGKNRIINGDFGVWQRGTSFTNPADGIYTADRWVVDSGGGTNTTISQQSTGAPNGSRYVMRIAQTGTSNKTMAQLMETNTCATFWGQTVVASVYLRRNATQTGSLILNVYKSATVDASRGATWTNIGSVTVANASLPTGTTNADWYRATVSFSVPNDGTANSLKFCVGDTANNPNGAYWEMGETQLEAGSVATPFTTATGTVQGELAACQRYYYRVTASSSGSPVTNSAGTFSTTETDTMVTLPVPMRVAPTSVDSNALAWQPWLNTSQLNISSIVLYSATNNCIAYLYGTISGGTANQAGYWRGTSSSGYLGLSAEL